MVSASFWINLIYTCVKHLMPPSVRYCVRRFEYILLRVLGHVLFPICGATAPLRGYKVSTKRYTATSGDCFLSCESERTVRYSKRPQDNFLSPETGVAVNKAWASRI